MGEMETVPILLVIANILFSYYGWKHREFFDRYCFRVGSIRRHRQYERLVGSAFLHADIPHLAFNMLALYSFATGLVRVLGEGRFLLLYGAALLAGSLLSLAMRRREPDYTAVGASGAVSGVIFAGILLFPESRIMLFLIPVPIPGWLFGIAYIGFSLFGMKRQWGNLGHDAHLGGALAGVLFALLFSPSLLRFQPLLVAALLLPPLLFLLYELLQSARLHRSGRPQGIRSREQAWLDGMLERISREGIGSLSPADRRRMRALSDRKRGFDAGGGQS